MIDGSQGCLSGLSSIVSIWTPLHRLGGDFTCSHIENLVYYYSVNHKSCEKARTSYNIRTRKWIKRTYCERHSLQAADGAPTSLSQMCFVELVLLFSSVSCCIMPSGSIRWNEELRDESTVEPGMYDGR